MEVVKCNLSINLHDWVMHTGPRPEVLVPQIDAPLLLLWGEKDPWTPANGPVSSTTSPLANYSPISFLNC